MKKYYEAYDERYKTVHLKGVSWSSEKSSPIVLDIIKKYKINASSTILEIGCGEGRDSKTVLESGYNLFATDISKEAIEYCKNIMPLYKAHFGILDCLNDKHQNKYDFIYSVAVIHMLVLEEDRNLFFRFINEHLTKDGIALICTMGDGMTEMQSDINDAFKLYEREHKSGKIVVARTSCRMVSFETFESEIKSNNLIVIEKGITSALPDFNSLMFAVVRKKAQ
ncbi:MAG: class I SAM-dependent methyltransferase [Lachnospiraceae bacterium]|nr:class I SAM-dependent methyltransferase [Lachnospiraceae bacterium]